MVKFVMTAAAVLAVMAVHAYELSWVRVNANCDIQIVKSETDTQNVKTMYQSWGDEAKRKQLVTFEITSPGSEQLTDFTFSFKIPVDAKVTLNLQGPYKKTGDKLERINVVFAEIKAEGATIRNGDFSAVSDGKPGWWNMYSANPESKPFCAPGKIVVWHNGFYNQIIDVPKDTVVTVSGKCRMAAPADLGQ